MSDTTATLDEQIAEVRRECGMRERVARGLSQTEIAGRVGVSTQQVSKYETGRDRLTVARLVALAAAMGADPVAMLSAALRIEHGPAAAKPAPLAIQIGRSAADLPGPLQASVLLITRALGATQKKSRPHG